MTRGHNIVADGWEGAYNPCSYPMLTHTQLHTDNHERCIKNARFHTFWLYNLRPTDRPIDRLPDQASYRVAYLQLKTFFKEAHKLTKIWPSSICKIHIIIAFFWQGWYQFFLPSQNYQWQKLCHFVMHYGIDRFVHIKFVALIKMSIHTCWWDKQSCNSVVRSYHCPFTF